MATHVIFDLDGTLADTEYETSIITADLAREKGWDLSAQEVFVHHAGLGAKEKFVSIAKVFGAVPTEADLDYLAEEHERRKKAIYDRADIPLMPGAKEAVAALSAGGAVISLASTNPSYRSKPVLDKAGMRDYFGDRVVGPDMTEGRKKPDPAVYLAAMAAQGIPAANTYVVEDTLPGIVAGHAAGAFVIAILDPRFGTGAEAQAKAEAFKAAGANAIVRSLDELKQYIPLQAKTPTSAAKNAPRP